MSIAVLDENTINKIAAGEVIERPSSIVKELLENAIDADATAITVEIRDGGTSLIRITDNGCGIEKAQVPMAFLRHATSKIRRAEDLASVMSLGFRGEALSSIAAVARVELITKTGNELAGSRYRIEGGMELGIEEVGVPEGTTFLVRDLFYNTPARKKFLKSPSTEGSYVQDFVEKIALSRPDISIRYVKGGSSVLHTSGNHNLKDIIYEIYGRELTANLLKIEEREGPVKVSGYICKPVVARSSRNCEIYFINGRYIKNPLISRAIEEAYRPFLMKHKFPFTVLHFTIDTKALDVNVHPAKMEVRFENGEAVYETVYQAVSEALHEKELIPQISLTEPKEEEKQKENGFLFPENKKRVPEPFEKKRLAVQQLKEPEVPYGSKGTAFQVPPPPAKVSKSPASFQQPEPEKPLENPPEPKSRQMDLFDGKLLEPKARFQHKLLGQLFDTYWLVEYQEQLFIIDQHAAHEKVLYEKTMKSLKERSYDSQMVSPPIILTLTVQEEVALTAHLPYFTDLGFEIEPFGGREYAVRGIPSNLLSIAKKELFMDMLGSLTEEKTHANLEMIYERVASMSCKAAVKGGHALNAREADQLIDELLELENPYACPHGRPTIISMSKYELEKKFKRIV